jgi:uncharacterized protein YaiE (UPF0345 family)
MNIEHRTPNVTPAAAQRLHSTFSVRCSMFDVFSGSWGGWHLGDPDGGFPKKCCQRDWRQAIMPPMKHNSYFDGKVQSLAVNTAEGYATVGVIEPGQYTFKTDAEERMQIVAGTLKAKLPGVPWQAFSKGQFFVVPAAASFDVEAAADVAYICHYKK